MLKITGNNIFTLALSLSIIFLGGCGLYRSGKDISSLEMTPKLSQEVSRMDENDAKNFLKNFIISSNNRPWGNTNKWGVLGRIESIRKRASDYFVLERGRSYITENSLEFDTTQNCISHTVSARSHSTSSQHFVYGGYQEGGLLQTTIRQHPGWTRHDVFKFELLTSAYIWPNWRVGGRTWLILGNTKRCLLFSPKHSKDFSKLVASFIVLCPNLKLNDPQKKSGKQ